MGEWPLRVAAIVVGTVIVVSTEILAAFLTPFRIGGTTVPISWVIVVAGIVAGIGVTRYGSGLGIATAIPAVAWFLVIVTLSSKTAEGDLIIPGTWVGYGVLLGGMLAILVTIAVTVILPRSRGPVDLLDPPTGRGLLS